MQRDEAQQPQAVATTLSEYRGAKVVNEKGGRAQCSLHDTLPLTVGLAEP